MPAALALAVAAVYWNSLRAPFQFDDEPAVRYNTTIRSLGELGQVLQPPADGAGVTGRPLVNLSLAVNYALGGLDVRGYHGMNVALHALAALALWGILRRTLRTGEWAAWSLALVWAVHPLLTESVVCIVQRNEILGGLFYLLTLYAFIRSVETGATVRGWQMASVLACLLGMASKEIMATAPLMVLLYDRTFVAGSFAGAWQQRKGYYLSLAGTWLLLAWLMLGNDQRAGTVGFGLGMGSWDYLLTQCRALTTYLKLSVWPHPLVVDYGMSVSTLGEVWWRGLLIVGLLGVTGWALAKSPAWGFLGAWFFVILAPSSSFVPLTTQTIAEHRMYLPLVAVVVTAGAGLWRLLEARSVGVGVALALGLGGLTVVRNRDYASALTLWESTAAVAPGNARAHLNFGQALFQAGRIPEAAARFEEAVRLRPEYAEAHYNAGLGDARMGRKTEAIGHFEEALRLAPDYAVAHNDLGIALAQAGRSAEAEAHFGLALRSRPDFAGAHFNLANLLLRSRRPAEAVPHLEAAIQLNPDLAEYRSNLAVALMQTGRGPEATAQYEAALRLVPDSPELHLNLGLTLAAAGRLTEAIPHVETALRLRPDFEPARRFLAQMQADLQRMEAAKAR